jgi:hypothetical protein
MRWNRLAGFLLPCLFIGGFLPSDGSSGLSLVPDCRSEELQDRHNQADPDSMHAWEQELFTIINKERTGRGLPGLDMDETLMRIARDHSREMAQQGFISHDQPSGNLQIRMNRVGYPYEVVRENVASAVTVAYAHKALLNSPLHKNNILAADVTRVGIGVVRFPSRCEKYLYITEVFAAPRDEYKPSMVQNLLENRVQDLRQQGGGAMDPDPLLDALASRSLLSLKVSYDRTELRNLLAASANELQENGETDLSQLEVNVQLLHNPKNLSIPASNREGQARTYGAAVRQVTDDRNQPAFLVLTLLGITR